MIDAPATGLTYLPLKLSRNKLTHTIEAADVALTSRVGLKYLLTLLVPEYPQSGNFVELHTSEGREKPLESQGGVSVFAGAEFRYNAGHNGKIDGLLRFQKPAWKQATMRVLLEQTTAYCLRESVAGGTPAVDTTNTLPKLNAIKAGLSNEDFYTYGEEFFRGYQSGKRQFLTWQPDWKTVGPGQEEYLSFVLNFSPRPQELRLRVQAADGDALTAMALQNPPLNAVVCLPVSPLRILPLLPAQTTRYEIWLSDENNQRLSETRTYLVDNSPLAWDRSLLFVNSLGGWDTLRLTGKGQHSLSVGQTTVSLDRPATASAEFSELRVIATDGERSLTVSTGYFGRNAEAQLRYLDELLLSEELYLITDKGHRPAQLVSNQLIDRADDPDLIARTFTFRLLETVEHYSALPASEPGVERAIAWRGRDLKHVLDGQGRRTGRLVFSRLEAVYADDNTLLKPYTIKPNVQGDPDYLAPITDDSIEPGSTPYPNAPISRAGTFTRTSCGAGLLGGQAIIEIPLGRWGGENPGDANALAEAEYNALNTQAYADTNGSCVINNAPIHLAIMHRIPMDPSSKVTASANWGPVVDLRVNNVEYIANTVGQNPATPRLSDATIVPGTYNILMRVSYSAPPVQRCKLRLASKNREILVTAGGFYLMDNVVISSSDEPLTLEVILA